MSLRIVPVTFRQACAFIDTHHRHHRPPQGMRFAVGVTDGTVLVGVATTGRPVARHLDDGATVEVTRVATDGTRNANSMLYASCWRIARAMGYHRLVTYTQVGESGASLRAAGFRAAAHLPPHHGWDRPGRRRSSDTGGTTRTRWEVRTSGAIADLDDTRAQGETGRHPPSVTSSIGRNPCSDSQRSPAGQHRRPPPPHAGGSPDRPHRTHGQSIVRPTTGGMSR